MIYSINCSGQMCNRILFFVHTLATAIDLKTDIVHPFGKEIRSFSGLHPEAIPEIKIRCFNWGRCLPVDVLHGLLQGSIAKQKEYCDGNVDRCLKWRERGAKNLFLWNWLFRNNDAVARHREKIVAYLRAKDRHCVRPNEVVGRLRDSGATVVGVHVRRGDYREAAPNWFFDDGTYLRFMKEFEASHGGKVRFVAVSNEPVDVSFFTANGIDLTVASGTPQEDIVTLSLCDYIMGPCSTFAWWAAYYGDKPRLAIRSRDEEVSLGRFAKVSLVR